jgi:hypothetical protein
MKFAVLDVHSPVLSMSQIQLFVHELFKEDLLGYCNSCELIRNIVHIVKELDRGQSSLLQTQRSRDRFSE